MIKHSKLLWIDVEADLDERNTTIEFQRKNRSGHNERQYHVRTMARADRIDHVLNFARRTRLVKDRLVLTFPRRLKITYFVEEGA